MNSIGIARRRPQPHVPFDKDSAETVRETPVKIPLPDDPVRQQNGLRRDGLPAGLLGRRKQKQGVDPIAGEKSKSGRQIDQASVLAVARPGNEGNAESR